MTFSSVLLLVLGLLLCHLSDSQEFSSQHRNIHSSLAFPSSNEQNTRFRSAAKRDPGASNCNVNSDCSSGSLCCEIFLDTASFKSGTCYDPTESICCSLDGSIVDRHQISNTSGECCKFDDNVVHYCPQEGDKCNLGSNADCNSACSQKSDCSGGDSCCSAPNQLSHQGSGSCYDSDKVCCFDGRVCNSSVCTVPPGGQCCAVNLTSGVFTFCGNGTRCGFYEDTVHCLDISSGSNNISQPLDGTNSTASSAPPGFISKKRSLGITLAITIPLVVIALIAIVIAAWAIRRKRLGGGKIVRPNINAPPAYSAPSAAPLMGDGLKFAGPSGAVIPPGYFSAVGMIQDPRYAAMGPGNDAIIDIDSHSAVEWSEIEVLGSIGQGSFGEVYKSKWHAAIVAVKKIHPQLLGNQEAVDNFYRESEILKKIRPHPNTVLFFGITREPVGLIMEFCENGSLYQHLHSSAEIPMIARRKFLTGIAKGMVHLHYYDIIHRDLAARNILLTESFNVKVSDFGFSQVMKLENHIRTPVGPVNWYPPEALRENIFSSKTDIWSFGVVVWEVVTRRDPFNDKASSDVIAGVSNGNLSLEIPQDCPMDLANLMRMCFKQVPAERPTFEDIVSYLEKEQPTITA